MAKIEFYGRSSEAPCRWVAVHHGLTGSLGLDHIHIAANIVAEDGTAWNDYNDRPRSQAACDAIVQELVFEREDGTSFQLSPVDGQAHHRGQRGIVKRELKSDFQRGLDAVSGPHPGNQTQPCTSGKTSGITLPVLRLDAGVHLSCRHSRCASGRGLPRPVFEDLRGP